MSLSGPEALRSLDEALRDIRREEDEIAKRLARSAELVTKFKETESELLRQLAEVRLDPASQAALAGRLSQAEVKAREMLSKHGAELSAAEGELKGLDKQIAALAKERTEQAAAAGKAQAELKALADRVAVEAVKNPEYAEKRKAAEQLAHIAEESLRKTQQAEADREQKGKPYRDDPLFIYLWERGFGTKNYRENNLIQYFDGLIAGLVGFPEARANFAMLNEIPLRLREHADRQEQIAEAAQQEVTKLEKAAVDAAGGRPTRELLEKAEARIAAIDQEMVGAEDKRDERARAQRELAQGSDPAFSAAVSGLAEALGREDIQTLLAEARATETGQDDTIVKQIDESRQRATEEDGDSREQKSRLKTLAARRRELEDIQYEFKKQNFDNPRSTFREDKLVGDLLNDFLRGGITAADYWGQWRRSQNWTGGVQPQQQRQQDSPWGGNSGGGFSWPDSSFGGGASGGNRRDGGFGGSWGRLPGGGGGGFGGGSSGGGSGGGFSRPRTGSSGNRTSGGFKTGGGF
ncbi:hypothetical protein VW23_001530 [Devosia insulae DS-56]|uniref:Uncharacterized protein n=1 Tax=Devosia insulae DS-56 TaxID=1116389 RepID=A0A1E5XMQ3_9HYPH|nr:hypothetical protein [Devosia insulae]OEO29896.1 hypothetical protein VW23_001530 [Devosia insulae DS-56]